MTKIDSNILSELVRHTRKLSFRNFILLSSMRYERCIEFPLIVEKLKSLFSKQLNLLDIGSGDSALPSYFAKKTNWKITLIDKFSWVNMQKKFVEKNKVKKDLNSINIINEDFLECELLEGSYDIITIISVIEHFSKDTDSSAMKKIYHLLRKDGICILTTPFNENYYKEFYLNKSAYGVPYKKTPVFFQRHYDSKSLEERLILPSGLKVIEKYFFGEYDFQFKEKFLDPHFLLRWLKIFYQWMNPYFVRKFCSIRDYPVSRKDMRNYTSSGVFLVLKKV